MTVKIAHETAVAPRPALGTALSRAFSGKCPNCGRGALFASYLRQVKSCADCGEAFGHIRSDDAAPWLTILVVGHILVPIVLMVESRTTWPLWASFALWLPITLGLTLAILPKAKAVFLAMIWTTKAPGSETD